METIRLNNNDLKFLGRPTAEVKKTDETWSWSATVEFNTPDGQRRTAVINSNLVAEILDPAVEEVEVRGNDGQQYALRGRVRMLVPGANLTWTDDQIKDCTTTDEVRGLLLRAWRPEETTASPTTPAAPPASSSPAPAEQSFPVGRTLLYLSLAAVAGGATYMAVKNRETIHTWLNEKVNFDVRVEQVKVKFNSFLNKCGEWKQKIVDYFKPKDAAPVGEPNAKLSGLPRAQ